MAGPCLWSSLGSQGHTTSSPRGQQMQKANQAPRPSLFCYNRGYLESQERDDFSEKIIPQTTRALKRKAFLMFPSGAKVAPAPSRALPLAVSFEEHWLQQLTLSKQLFFCLPLCFNPFWSPHAAWKNITYQTGVRTSLERQLLLGSDEACSPRATHRPQYSLTCHPLPSCSAWAALMPECMALSFAFCYCHRKLARSNLWERKRFIWLIHPNHTGETGQELEQEQRQELWRSTTCSPWLGQFSLCKVRSTFSGIALPTVS